MGRLADGNQNRWKERRVKVPFDVNQALQKRVRRAGREYVQVEGRQDIYRGRIVDISTGTGTRPVRFGIETADATIHASYLPDGTPLAAAIFTLWHDFEGVDKQLFEDYVEWLETDKVVFGELRTPRPFIARSSGPVPPAHPAVKLPRKPGTP
jgi:hypothetical protein